MSTLSTHLIDSILQPKDDSHEDRRAEVRQALADGDPGARKQVFDFANTYWADIATEAWNEGERSMEIMAVCKDVRRLCEWVYETPRVEDEDRYDAGGAVTTSGMMLFVLGDTDEAIERFRQITSRPVNSYFHESTYEKLISVLIKENRTDEAMAEVDQLLEHYPHNELGHNCRNAYATDMANAGSSAAPAAKIDPDTYTRVSEALTAQYAADMEALVAQGLSPAEMQVRMGDAQKAFQSTMELLSRLL